MVQRPNQAHQLLSVSFTKTQHACLSIMYGYFCATMTELAETGLQNLKYLLPGVFTEHLLIPALEVEHGQLFIKLPQFECTKRIKNHSF